MEHGWVYVVVNATIPGMAKVGRTTRTPEERVAELSGATGVATPFVLVFQQAFVDCVAAERGIHAILDRCGMRVAPNREFFRGPITDIILLILQYAIETGDGATAPLQQSGHELLEQGDRHLFGEGDTLQDLSEAMRYYQLAVARGSGVACERLGALMAQFRSTTRGGKARAMSMLKEGARRGDYYCFCEMAAIAAEEDHVANFIKAWERFFVQRAAAFLEAAESGKDRYATALQRYVVTCFSLGITPGHIDELTPHADVLVSMLAKTLDQARGSPNARKTLLVTLRWAHRALLHRPYTGEPVGRFAGWLVRWVAAWRRGPAWSWMQ